MASEEKARPGARTGAGSPKGEGGRGRNGGTPAWARDGAGSDTAVPVEVAAVERRDVSSFLETNGALEAENDVSIVSRTQGPIVELAAEEEMQVEAGQLLIRIDDTEHRAQVEIARVAVDEASRAHDRAKASLANAIISQEVYDQALSRLESTKAQLRGAEIVHEYTRVVAPFSGVIVTRFVKYGETVSQNQELFRIADFDPLLCKIQVPEKELARLKRGQRARLQVEAWPEEQFDGEVLRISPVVDATTGTIQVTLQVRTHGKLRPGMFARVFLVTDTHADALVMPKSALSLESLSDTVFVVSEGEALRRSVTLGYEETDVVEVVEGLSEGERVVVVGQDGLTDGTPIQVLRGPGGAPPERSTTLAPGSDGDGPNRRRRIDFSNASEEQIERMKQGMRERGMTDEEIERAIERRRQRQGAGERGGPPTRLPR